VSDPGPEIDLTPGEPRFTPAAWWRDIKVAAAFLTRLPIFGRGVSGGAEGIDDAEEAAFPVGDLRFASRAFPIIGLGVGLAGAVILILAKFAGLGAFLAATLAIATTVVVTGALHEDGLADAADGFGAGRDREAKLAIMRDTRMGAFAVLALVISLLLRIGALAGIGGTYSAAAALIAAASFSRAVLPAVMASLDHARAHGLAVTAGKPPQESVIVSLVLGAVFLLLLLGPGTGFIALLCGVAAAATLAALAQAKLGGFTGDVLGAIQQGTEIAVLLAAAAS